MYTIARNLCADAARRERVRGAESLDEQAAGKDGEEGRPLVDEVPGDGAAPDRGAESLRLRPVLLRALAALPPEQREVFVLREQAGLPFREIAEMLGVNENTVKSRMRYALEGLRRLLAEAGVTGDEADAQRTGTRAGTP
jgi:RNA polymerase sigma-70 factor (ECF subfamily)